LHLIIAPSSGRRASDVLRFGGITWPLAKLSTAFSRAMKSGDLVHGIRHNDIGEHLRFNRQAEANEMSTVADLKNTAAYLQEREVCLSRRR
jgi:hypothetical protein